MSQPEKNMGRLWQVSARITLPKSAKKEKNQGLTFVNTFKEQCLYQKEGIEVWLRCDSPSSIVSIPSSDLVRYESMTGQEDRVGQDMGFLHPEQHPYKLVTRVCADKPEDALNMIFQKLDLLTDILTFQLQHPVKIIQLEITDVSENLKKGDRREMLTCCGTPYFGIAKDAGAMFLPSGPISARIDPNQVMTELPEDIKAGLRWFTKGLSAFPVVDKFTFFWIALEILVSHLVPTEKRFFRCSKCRHEMKSCPSCGYSTAQRPNIKQRIKTFVLAQGRAPTLFDHLWETRQLFHGRIKLEGFQEIEKMPELVNELKAIVVDALKANLGIPQREPPFSPVSGIIGWSSVFLHGYQIVDS